MDISIDRELRCKEGVSLSLFIKLLFIRIINTLSWQNIRRVKHVVLVYVYET